MSAPAAQLDLLDLLAEPDVTVTVPALEPPADFQPAPPPIVEGRGGASGTTGPGAAWLRSVAYWPGGRRVTWTAPWDCGEDTRAGDVLPAYRCPHCRVIEVNEYHLQISHGVTFYRPETWHPDVAGAWEECSRQRLTASQAAAARARGLATYRCRHCGLWSDEQMIARARRQPYDCSGTREDHDWRADVPP